MTRSLSLQLACLAAMFLGTPGDPVAVGLCACLYMKKSSSKPVVPYQSQVQTTQAGAVPLQQVQISQPRPITLQPVVQLHAAPAAVAAPVTPIVLHPTQPVVVTRVQSAQKL